MRVLYKNGKHLKETISICMVKELHKLFFLCIACTIQGYLYIICCIMVVRKKGLLLIGINEKEEKW